MKNERTAQQNIDILVDQAERLGVIGSPSSTSELTLDILGSAVTRKLVGELALFRFSQDACQHYALGQITEVLLRNIWHEDPTMRSLIRQRGRVDPVSERQDTHSGKMTISAVFGKLAQGELEPSLLGTVPSTGTFIHIVDDRVLNALLNLYRDQLFYMGHVYGSKPLLPLWFKHFDHGPQGAGEAYHLGIFGKTGSGKSVLAKMILLAYARHPSMAILVIDPQGEFSKDIRSGRGTGEFALPLGELLKGLKRPIATLSVQSLVLDRWELFEQILYESPFFERLSMPKGENRQIACNILIERLKDKRKIALKSVNERTSFDVAWEILNDPDVQQVIYRSLESRGRFNAALQAADKEDFFAIWTKIAGLFHGGENKRTVDAALSWLLSSSAKDSPRPLLIIDLSREQAQGAYWNDHIQELVIKRLLDGLTQTAESHFKDEKSLNALVIIDEAHRLAPRSHSRDDAGNHGIRRALVDAARTTRKYGLGWLFISQTLSSIDTEIISQMRILFFGFGLALGQEYESLRQLVGSSASALDLYRLFRDPHSAFSVSSRQYSFMTVGPVSPLSFAGTPLFFNVFGTVDKFIEANQFKLPQ
ncbi:MAG TPA: ATP-binding protein [Ktedonobacterales bacterium]|jgi:hypothetical protein